MTECEKMQAGQWYCCLDPELDALRARARRAVHAHNTCPPDTRGALAPELQALFASTGSDCFLEAPFHCAYGVNIRLGQRVYFNAGCVVLDTAPVRVGDGTMFGPHVQIYCAQHAKDPVERAQGLEIGLPVTIGQNVWVGGGAILMPGITIGDNATIGAGSVVTKDVVAEETVVGNPARALKQS
ncbi:Maltose O-acetyltransferase [Ruegeria denitrificans]|uniref:Nodulation protein L n=1 Tax=Ruegeria denitrificans TaxID=1715692 RepID=A0A0P1I3Q5_9RHOB|nr:sugar O-acetyltransferase [Ruegeria denitrificans]CUJ88594.1 Maltose O-acetyltransferase [Ruegeria denitrificans]